MKIFIGNLSWNATEDDLREAFQKYGELVSIRIVTDPQTGRSRGFAFIEFSNEDAADKAIAEMDNFQLHGRPIRVSKARQEDRSGSGRPPRQAGAFSSGRGAPRSSHPRGPRQNRFEDEEEFN